MNMTVPASPEVTARSTTYEVTILPDDPNDGDLWSNEVQYAGAHHFGQPKPVDEQWAIRLRGHWCLSRTGTWDMESIPSERTDEWLTEHRFSLEDALERAKKEAPHVLINGKTALERKQQLDRKRTPEAEA